MPILKYVSIFAYTHPHKPENIIVSNDPTTRPSFSPSAPEECAQELLANLFLIRQAKKFIINVSIKSITGPTWMSGRHLNGHNSEQPQRSCCCCCRSNASLLLDQEQRRVVGCCTLISSSSSSVAGVVNVGRVNQVNAAIVKFYSAPNYIY